MATIEPREVATPAKRAERRPVDDRPLGVQALHWLGVLALCSPPGVLAVAATDGHDRLLGFHDDLFTTLIGGGGIFLLATAFVWVIVAGAAQRANPNFDMDRPDTGEFVKGALMAPLWLACWALLIVAPLLFLGGSFGLAFWIARRL